MGFSLGAHFNKACALGVALVVVEKSGSDRVELLFFEELNQFLLINLESEIAHVNDAAWSTLLSFVIVRSNDWRIASWWSCSSWSEV